MENLKDYGSSNSSSNSDCELDISNIDEKSNKAVNYFGFYNDSKDEFGASSPKKLKSSECQEQILVDDTMVEIPSSPFWQDISSEHFSVDMKSSSSVTAEDEHKLRDKIQNKYGCRKCVSELEATTLEIPTSQVNSENSNADIFVKDQRENRVKETINYSSMSSKQNRLAEDGEIRYFNHVSNQTSASGKSEDWYTRGGEIEKRKLFYVHSKIQPHLNNRAMVSRIHFNLEKQLIRHSGVVNRVKWNIPNYSHIFVSASMDATVKLWNVWSCLNPCVMSLSHHSKAVFDVEWSRCGRKLLSCSYDRTALLTDVETGKVLRSFELLNYVSCGKHHTVDPNLILIGTMNSIQCWDLRIEGHAFRKFTAKDYFGQVQDVIFTEDGGTFFSCSDLVSKDSADRNIMAWDFSTGVILSNQIYQERYICTRLKPHPQKQEFLAQSHGGYVAIFSLNKPYKITKSKRFEGHKLQGYNIGFDITPDGKFVLSGSSDGNIHCYDYQTGKSSRKITTGLDVCMDINYHPLLKTFVCGGWNGVIQVWS